jgi:hypothetical protein
MNTNLSYEDLDLIIEGLNMKCNYIESGNPILSGADAARIKRANENSKHGWRSNPDSPEPNVLSIEQMELVVHIRKLINKLTLLQIRSKV